MRIPQVFTLIHLIEYYNKIVKITIVRKQNIPVKQKKKRIHPLDISALESLLSDSNQRPRDYKSRALAN